MLQEKQRVVLSIHRVPRDRINLSMPAITLRISGKNFNKSKSRILIIGGISKEQRTLIGSFVGLFVPSEAGVA